MKKFTLSLMAAATLAIGLQACGSDDNNATTTNTNNTTTQAPADAPAQATTVELNAGDDMKYDKNEITVKPGQEVTIVLHHTGKMGKDVMGHNFVLLQKDVDPMAFANKAIDAKDNDYIPADAAGDVIAHTKTIGGGETTQITFKAPTKAGAYDYICSFPGHAAQMHGKFFVME